MLMQNKPTMLLLGAYGQSNLGDELLLSTFIQKFSKDFDLVVNSTNPLETREKFKVKTFDTNKSKVELLKALMKAKYVCFGGGSQFKTLPDVFKRKPESLLINIFLVSLMAKLLFKKLYFISVGAGPLDTSLSKFMTKLIVLLSDAVLIRDTQSFELMQSVSNSKKIILSSDGLYFAKERIDTFASNSIDTKLNNRTVVISPNLNLKDESLIGTEVDVLAEVCDFLVKEGYSLKFIPFQIGFSEIDDLKASKMIVERMTVKLDYNPIAILEQEEEIYPILNAATLVLGVRLHSVIIGTLCKTPAIAVSYDPKVKGYMIDLGLNDLCFDIKPDLKAEDIIESFKTIIRSYQQYVGLTIAGVNRTKQKLDDSLQNLPILKTNAQQD